MSAATLIVLLWAANLVTDTCGQLAFKAAAMENREARGWAHWRHMLARPWIYVGALLYIAEFVAWLAFLSTVTLAEGVLLGMAGIVTVMIGGRLWFKERFTRPRVIGVTLILAGVALVGLGG
ncbi:MAG: EamA family transporter [Zoogloeaceae bacterium]|jgi:drug/metabolite transporter (DMT)-like permease|nr:EamA family transporter [Zoogloeaceae bacterium]